MLTWQSIIAIYHEIIGLAALYMNDCLVSYAACQNQNMWLQLVINLSLNGLVGALIMKLLSFHIYLRFQGLTTYKYILREKEIETHIKA